MYVEKFVKLMENGPFKVNAFFGVFLVIFAAIFGMIAPPVLCMLHKVPYAYIFCHGRNWKFVKRAIMLGSINYVQMYIYIVSWNSIRFIKCRYLLFVFFWYLFPQLSICCKVIVACCI